MRWNVILPSRTAASIPLNPGSVSTIHAANFATSVALNTAMPICAWLSAGASLAPSPHMPTMRPALCRPPDQPEFVLRKYAGKDAECAGAGCQGSGCGAGAARRCGRRDCGDDAGCRSQLAAYYRMTLAPYHPVGAEMGVRTFGSRLHSDERMPRRQFKRTMRPSC